MLTKTRLFIRTDVANALGSLSHRAILQCARHVDKDLHRRLLHGWQAFASQSQIARCKAIKANCHVSPMLLPVHDSVHVRAEPLLCSAD